MNQLALTSPSTALAQEITSATYSPTVMTGAPMTTAWSLDHATADHQTVLPTTTVSFLTLHLQTRLLGSATTTSTLTSSKRQTRPSASSAAMGGWTAVRSRPQLCQSVWEDNGNPLKLYRITLSYQKFWPSQALYRNQMILSRLTVAVPS